MDAPVFAASDKPSALQYPDVLRNGGKRHAVRRSKLGNRSLPKRQLCQYPAAGCVGKRGKGGIESGIHMVNHMV